MEENLMVTKFQFPTMEGESKGGLISLAAEEYQYIASEIIAIMQEVFDSGRELTLEMSTGRLLINLNIGLSFIYEKEHYAHTVFIYPGQSGTFRFRMRGIDYLVLVEEIRDHMKYCFQSAQTLEAHILRKLL